MSFPDLVVASQRLHILQLLEQDAGYSHNQHILASGLEALGHAVGMVEVREHIRWLEQAGLLVVRDVHGIGLVASINRAGVDVAMGRVRVDGVERPLPGS